jgi:hypothetical protein
MQVVSEMKRENVEYLNDRLVHLSVHDAVVFALNKSAYANKIADNKTFFKH